MQVKKNNFFSELFTNNTFEYSFVLFVLKQSLHIECSKQFK